MNSLPAPDNRLYLGKGGSGKTTLALHHAAAFERELICNPNGEDAHQQHADVTDDPRELIELAARKGSWRICFNFNRTGLVAGFRWVNRVALARGDLCLVWDEADLLTERGRLPPEAYELWNAGRHHRVRILALSRRPANVSPDVRGNLARACVFRMIEPRDLQWLATFMEPDAARAVTKLQRYEAVDWTEAGWSVKKSVFR